MAETAVGEEDGMTGEQALQCMELALLRVRDQTGDRNLYVMLDKIAHHLAEFQREAILVEDAAKMGRKTG
jgi:hypothetical protein